MQADNAAAEARGEIDTLRAQLEATGANIEAEIAERQRAEKEATKAVGKRKTNNSYYLIQGTTRIILRAVRSLPVHSCAIDNSRYLASSKLH